MSLGRFTAALLLAGLLPLAARGEDWPRFLGPRADGTSHEAGLLKAWPKDGPPRVWGLEVGTGYSAPSILGNRLVLHHRVKDQEVVECFDKATGRSLWRHGYPSGFIDPYGYNNGPRCTPTLTPTRVYTYGAEGKLLCLDLETGKMVWERDTQKEWRIPEAFFGVGSTPLLDGGLLHVMLGGQPNSGMAAFDAETGKVVWENVGASNWEGAPMLGWPGERVVKWRDWDKQASYATPVLAEIHGQKVLLALMRQGLVALNPATGKVHFSFWFRSSREESVNAANPVVVGSRILISAAYYKVGSVLLEVAEDLKSAKEVWRGTSLEIHWTTPIVHEGHVFAFSGRNEPDSRFRCVEWNTGKIAWDQDEAWERYRTGPLTYGRGSAILAEGKLIALGETGVVGLFEANPRAAVEISRFKPEELEYPCWTAPALSDGRLYLRSEKRLLCFDLLEKPRPSGLGLP